MLIEIHEEPQELINQAMAITIAYSICLEGDSVMYDDDKESLLGAVVSLLKKSLIIIEKQDEKKTKKRN
jgi:hypothetical protein